MIQDESILEFQKEFLGEAGYLLEQCEESFLNLEKSKDKAGELGKIYRNIHTFKGAGAAVGFHDLAEFAHVIEDGLSILRVYPKLLTSEMVTILLKVSDALKKRVEVLSHGQAESWDNVELLKEIEELREVLREKSESRSSESVYANSDQILAAVDKVDQRISRSSEMNTTVKIDTERIDQVLDSVGELVVIKSQLINETQDYASQNLKLSGIISLLDRTIRDLQDRALGMRMMPMRGVFLKLQRIVRDLSVKLNKQVEFIIDGEDVEMDRTMVEMMGDPLMHLVRNSLDHGIEKKEARMNNGKSEKGRISIAARISGGRVVIEIKDDGAGLHREKIIQKAVANKMIKSDADAHLLSDQEVFQMIFAPGFSTAEKVTDISGRGVGLDVVKSSIEKLRGNISIESVFGQGTTFRISLPMTTTITDGLLVHIHDHPLILPIDTVIELVDTGKVSIENIKTKGKFLNNRGTIIPLVDLRNIFGRLGSQNSESSAVVIVQSAGKPTALVVDCVLGQTQVVQKPLNQYFSGRVGLGGAAILGDGRVALVVDVESLTPNLASYEMSGVA